MIPLRPILPAILSIPLLLIELFRIGRSRVKLRRAALEYLFGLYLLTLAAVVFLPLVVDPAMRARLLVRSGWINLVPLATVTGILRGSSPGQAVVQLVGNIALFFPLGLLGPMLFQRLRRFTGLLGTAALCSLGIEVTQLLMHVTHFSVRSFDIDDVLLNISGALIGFAAWAVVSNLTNSRPRGASKQRSTMKAKESA